MRSKYLKGAALAVVVSSLFCQVNAQSKDDLKRITRQYDLSTLKRMERSFDKQTNTERKRALRIAKRNGWETKFTTKDGRLVELQKVIDGKPIYYSTFNVAAARSTRVNHLNSGGSLGLNLMGQNMRAYIWDGGVASVRHQEYDGPGGTNRYTVGDGSRQINFHAAHVTGTVMASGYKAKAKGMAPHARVTGYDWNSDKAEATSAASNGMLVSNHSYGYAIRDDQNKVQLPQYYFGGYIDESRDWDEIMFNAPNYLMVVAAGNDGLDDTANRNPVGGYGFDKLTGHSTSKNNLVVANAEDANINSNGDLISVSINSSSSEGPTDDYRIKPDITGNGTKLYSSFDWVSADKAFGTNNADGNINDDYASITGTSMASPNVTGSLLLLQQHYNNVNNEYMRGATLKGLALHTADDAGSNGPDAIFGWGLLNAKKAAQVISNNKRRSKIEELTLNSGDSYTITVKSDGSSPLLASICWMDRPGQARKKVNDSRPVLVNDLDVRVTKDGQTYYPYKLTGATSSERKDNNVDPFERIDINNASGTYTITVTNKGSLRGGSQDFSLIVTGIVVGDGDGDGEDDKPTNYCSSKGEDSSDEHIQRVQLGSIDKTSGADSYSNFTSESTGLSNNESYTIKITPKWSGSAYKEGYSVWIDYNQDGDFTDSGEIVFSKSPTSDSTISGEFTVPASAKLGKTRMRVSMKYSGVPKACESIQYGEVEDYTVVIGGGDSSDTKAPTAPKGIRATDVTETTATLVWTASRDNVAVVAYDIYYGSKKVGTVDEPSVDLSKLKPATSYTLAILARDAAGNESAKTKVTFRTSGGTSRSYCVSKGKSSKDEWIDYVAFGGMVNASGNDGGYKDNTAKVATVSRGGVSELVISAGFKGKSYNEYWAVWIDYNQDGVFGDNEKVADGNSSSADKLTAKINIPSNAVLGETRMRVSMKFKKAQKACEVFKYGEVEDYSVNITNNGYYYSQLNERIAGDSNTRKLGYEDVAEFMVYPNPATNFIAVQLGTKETDATYRIVNVIGQEVQSGALKSENIDISQLKAGVYIVEVNDGQKLHKSKILKK